MSDTDSDHEIRRGQVYTTPDGPVKVVGVSGDLMVTDPTATHPQDARAGTWMVERSLFEEDLDDGTIERGTLAVTDETVAVSEETAEVALRELRMLIEATEEQTPDPLQDDVFRAKHELESLLETGVDRNE